MMLNSMRRFRNVATAVALLSIWSIAATAQQSGTVLHDSLTILGGPTTVMEVNIAGPKGANSETDLLLQFGPDGNSRTNPVPDPSLSDAVRFTVSASIGGSRDFTTTGGAETQLFSNKIVAFAPVDDAPGLYALSIIHRQDILSGTTETWKVQVSGLPRAGLRMIASLRQGTFRSLMPTGVSQGPPTITLAPSPVVAGTMATFTVKASGGIDLSNVALSRVTIAPNDGISNLSLGNATPDSIVLSFNIANCTRPGDRTLTISDSNVSASTVFPMAAMPQVPGISVVPNRVMVSSTSSLNVTSTGCFDLSDVTPSQVSLNPNDGISNLRVTQLAPSSLGLSFAVAGNASLGNRRLVIDNGDASAAAVLEIARPSPPPRPPPPHHCGAGQRCCEDDGEGSCTMCIPKTSQCR
jgi:hypothetical protein